MAIFQDQIGNSIELHSTPKRIISLVPSITEFLSDINLDKEVVGITKFCVHPKTWLKEKAVVGGTKQQHIDQIKDLKPDLIIANKEENTKDYVDQLADICPIYVSEVNDFDSSIEMMLSIGKITDKEDESNRLVEYIKKEFDSLSIPNQQTKVAYCIWKNPWMWAGSANYISNMLELCGFKNVIDIHRYPEISMDDIINKKPELVFLSSEPFPFKEEHISELKKEYPNTNFKIVDGEMFSWYGSRMLKLPNYAQLLLSEIESETI